MQKNQRVRFNKRLSPQHWRIIAISLGILSLLLNIGYSAEHEYQEAPVLNALVEAGELPPVEDRLPIPEDVMVLEPVEQVGVYGGTLRMMHANPGMDNLKLVINDPPVRWNRDFTDYTAGLFRDWEYNEDGTVVTFLMRRGLKWSDGAPFTTEDIRFYWEDLALNEDFGDVPAPWWGYSGGSFTMELEIIDEHTFAFHFDEPNWNIPFVLASGYWNFEPMMAPKHFLQSFHPRYNSDIEGYTQLTENRNWWQTPGFPTLFAWHVTEYTPGERVVFDRNPYYWKVDTEGNQLPYIDRIVSIEVADEQVQLLRVISGDIDLNARVMPSPRNVPVLIENEERGGYRWLDGWRSGAGGWPALIVNQTYVGDDYIRELLRDKNFRRALSLGIDREVINEAVWFGLGTPQQATISRESWHFQSPEGQALFEEWASSFAEYAPERAEELLDAAGLDRRSSDGWRLRADNGNPLELRLDVGSWGTLDANQETAGLLERQFAVLGIRLLVNQPPQAEFDRMLQSGESMLMTARVGEMDLWTFPDWVFITGNAFRAWPAYTDYYRTGGASGEQPDAIAQQLHDLYVEGLRTSDFDERQQLVFEAIRLHIDEGPFFIGIAGDVPMPAIANQRLRNIPNYAVIVPSAVGGIGTTDPPQYFFGD